MVQIPYQSTLQQQMSKTVQATLQQLVKSASQSNQGMRRPIGKQSIGNNLFWMPAISHVETAKLNSAEQNNSLGIHLGHGVGNTHPIQGAKASHKTDKSALNTRR